MTEPICRFAETLRHLLPLETADAFEHEWDRLEPDAVGWAALPRAWRWDRRIWESVLDEVDGLLHLLLLRVEVLHRTGGAAAERVGVFCRAELERLQHATAAGLVAQRFGTAGLRTLLDDHAQPTARRYFAFLAVAERHPPRLWSLFRAYLRPHVHHAFQAVAVEAARYYPDRDTAKLLVDLFRDVRADQHRRAFLSPRILESLFVLDDARTLPFFRELLVAGYTHPDPEWCEVTRALVMVRRFTGAIEPNVKFPDGPSMDVEQLLDRAEELFERAARRLHVVSVI